MQSRRKKSCLPDMYGIALNISRRGCPYLKSTSHKKKKSDGVTDVLVPNWAAIEAQPTDSRQRFPGRLPPQRRQPLPAV